MILMMGGLVVGLNLNGGEGDAGFVIHYVLLVEIGYISVKGDVYAIGSILGYLYSKLFRLKFMPS